MANMWSKAISLCLDKGVPRSRWRVAPLASFTWPQLDHELFLARPCLPVMVMWSFRILDPLLLCRMSVNGATWMNLIINVFLRGHSHICTWRPAGNLSGMSMRWSMTGSCAARCKARLQCLT